MARCQDLSPGNPMSAYGCTWPDLRRVVGDEAKDQKRREFLLLLGISTDSKNVDEVKKLFEGEKKKHDGKQRRAAKKRKPNEEAVSEDEDEDDDVDDDDPSLSALPAAAASTASSSDGSSIATLATPGGGVVTTVTNTSSEVASESTALDAMNLGLQLHPQLYGPDNSSLSIGDLLSDEQFTSNLAASLSDSDLGEGAVSSLSSPITSDHSGGQAHLGAQLSKALCDVQRIVLQLEKPSPARSVPPDGLHAVRSSIEAATDVARLFNIETSEAWRSFGTVTDALRSLPTAGLGKDEHVAVAVLLGRLRLATPLPLPAAGHVDFLFVVCSPTVSPLPQASIEAHANAACVERAGLTAIVHSDGLLTELNTLILHRQPRVIVFAGHADATLPSSKRTLGLTDASGRLVLMSPETIASVLSGPSDRLELISLNGCCSSELCETITIEYKVATCGWSSKTADAAAKVHSLGLVDALTQRMKAKPGERLTNDELRAAFSHGSRSVEAVSARGSGKWALVDPASSAGGKMPDGMWAAGKPVLLLRSQLHDVPPSLPAHFQHRPEQADLRDALVSGVRGDGVVVGIVGASPVTGIAGSAGLGKTTTANWLALDPHVQTAYHDGIFWLEFGKERTAFQRLIRLAELLRVEPEKLERLERRGIDSLRDEVGQRLSDRRCLIVLDDVWDQQQPKPFRRLAGGGVTVLMTTRKSFIVEAFGEQLSRLPLRPMEEGAAASLIAQSSGKAIGELHGPSLATLVKMSAGVPAMLRSIGRMCSTRSPEAVVRWFTDHKLMHRMPTSMASADGYQQDAAEGNLFLAYEGQLDGLAERDEELASRCTMLAIFPEDTEVPLAVLAQLWAVADAAEVREVVERLGAEHLVEIFGDGERIRLIDPVRDYLRCRGKSDLGGWHAKLLGACRATEVGGDEGASGEEHHYWEEREGRRRFMHHVQGCGGKLGSRAPARLTTLNLESIGIGSAGVEALTNLIKCNETISALSVGANNITGEGAKNLAKVVLEHKTLINFCGIPLVSLRENTLEQLNLQSKGMGVPGAIVLSRLLPAATLLTSLNVRYNSLNSAGEKLLQDAAKGKGVKLQL